MSKTCIAESLHVQPRETSRELVVLRGDVAALRDDARRWLEGSQDTLWVGAQGEGRVLPRQVRALLGQARDAVVLELFGGLDLEVLAQVEGLVRRGGRLILLLPQALVADPALAVEPFAITDVGVRAADRLRAMLPPNPPRTPMRAVHAERGTDEQARLIEHLASRWAGAPSRTALVADRGRGKSSALGLAIARLGKTVIVSGPHPDAVREVLRFGGALAQFEPLDALLEPTDAEHLVIDEAAQIDVPTLRRIAMAHLDAHLTWASTARGYEGTGAGWVQRFLAWAKSEGPLEELALTQPIRFGEGDALERWVREVLLFDAAPATLSADRICADRMADAVTVRAVSRDELCDPNLLAQVYGLLMHAHHRTSPGDLARLLDAPNLTLHVALEAAHEGSRVVGVNLVAEEGALSLDRSRALARERIRGHVLPDTLVSHGGSLEAGTLRMIRSVRVATHPERRRMGIARLLTEHVHRDHLHRDHLHADRAPDLFGTVFGASAELVAFRQALGYRVVRMGSAVGARSGEPSVVMIRAVSEAGHALVEALRSDVGRNLPLQLRLLAADGAPLAPALVVALADGLADASQLAATDADARVQHYLESGQTFEAAAFVLHAFASQHEPQLARLDRADAALIRARVIDLASWRSAARAAGLTVAVAQRRLRGALASLASLTRGI